jgi:hypothetical protein
MAVRVEHHEALLIGHVIEFVAGLNLDGGLGGEAKETALFLPIIRQILAQPQERYRRQRDGLTAREECMHDVRGEIRQPNKRSEPALIHSEASAHGLDTVVRS